MIRYYGRPDRVAQGMIDALETGAIKTPGQWQSFVDHLDALPFRLKVWTIDRIRKIAGDTATEYIISRMNRPVPAALAFQGVGS